MGSVTARGPGSSRCPDQPGPAVLARLRARLQRRPIHPRLAAPLLVAVLETGRTPWTAVLDTIRLGLADDATAVTAAPQHMDPRGERVVHPARPKSGQGRRLGNLASIGSFGISCTAVSRRRMKSCDRHFIRSTNKRHDRWTSDPPHEIRGPEKGLRPAGHGGRAHGPHRDRHAPVTPALVAGMAGCRHRSSAVGRFVQRDTDDTSAALSINPVSESAG